MSPQLTTENVTPTGLVITASTAAALKTAVDAQTKILTSAYRMPASGATSGAVMNGSITLSPVLAFYANNGVAGYMQTVLWQAYV